MHILKSRKGVPIVVASLIVATPPVVATSPIVDTSPVAATPSIAATPPLTAKVPIEATPPIGATPLATTTLSYENTPNILTNDGYWYNSNEGDRVPNDGNDGHTHSSPTNDDNSTPMEMDEVIGIVGEPSEAGVAIKALMEGKDKGVGKKIVRKTATYKIPSIPQCIKQFRHLTKKKRSVGDYAFATYMDDE